MNRRFRNHVGNQKLVASKLPLTHATDAYAFRDIYEHNILEPKPSTKSDGFGRENLLYMFLGRPAYRPNYDEDATSLGSYFPICLILKKDISVKPKRIFPFDSGAFINNLFVSHMHHNMIIKDFALEPSLNAAAKLISLFFGSDQAYFDADPVGELDISPLEFEIESYYELIKDKSKNSYDDRHSAVELQFDMDIPITKENILAVVLPNVFLDDEHVRTSILSRWDAEALPYDTWRMQPREFTSVIFQLVKDYYVREGIL